jgi:hypothetical protein
VGPVGWAGRRGFGWPRGSTAGNQGWGLDHLQTLVSMERRQSANTLTLVVWVVWGSLVEAHVVQLVVVLTLLVGKSLRLSRSSRGVRGSRGSLLGVLRLLSWVSASRVRVVGLRTLSVAALCQYTNNYLTCLAAP